MRSALVVVGAVSAWLVGCEGESRVRDGGSRGGSSGSAGSNATGGDAGSAMGGTGAGVAGSAGTPGGGAGASSGTAGAAAGGGNVPGLPEPTWVPSGVFGELVDRYVRARKSNIQALCCEVFCCDNPDDLAYPIACLGEEYHIHVPPAGWLACASRLAATNAEVSDFLARQASCYEECASRAWPKPCESGEEPTNCVCFQATGPAALETCAADGRFNECPSSLDAGVTSGVLCNRRADCPDSFDELNCDPSQPSFRCASGERVPWLSLCDGTPDCPDATDEFACTSSFR